MKFPRNARIFRGQLEAAPFISMLFLLILFLLVGSLVYTPGVRLELPVADNLPGTDKPTVSVALDANGRLYFDSQLIAEENLKQRLKSAADNLPTPPTLLVQADEGVSYKMLIRLTLLAREAGITEALLVTLPRAVELPPNPL